MTTVYHELLPKSYLLLLAPGPAGEPELALAHSLRCACRSGKPAVWVDCEQVHDLSRAAVAVLCHYQLQLRERHMRLVLVHASEEVQRRLQRQGLGSALRFAPTIAAAALQSGPRLRA